MSGRVATCPRCIIGQVITTFTSPTCNSCRTTWLSTTDLYAEMAKVEEGNAAYILDGRYESELRALASEARLQMYLDVMDLINYQYAKTKKSLSLEKQLTFNDDLEVIHSLEGEMAALSNLKMRLSKMMEDEQKAEKDGTES